MEQNTIRTNPKANPPSSSLCLCLSSRLLQAERAERGLALPGLEVEDEHGQHGDPRVLDLRQLQSLQLLDVGDVDAVADLPAERERVEELPAGVALVAGGVDEVLGGAGPRGGPLHGLRLRVEEVHPPLALHPPHQEQLGAQQRPEREGRHRAGVRAGLEPGHAAPRLPHEDAHHRRHGPPPVDQLRLSVPLQERRVLPQTQRVEPVVAWEPVEVNALPVMIELKISHSLFTANS